MTSLDALKEALQTAQATWTGCDWDTKFGSMRQNLKGLSSRQSPLAAQATRGTEAGYWREVAQYLGGVEHDARAASELAVKAIDLWSLGKVLEALSCLEEAIALEARYREPVAYQKLLPLMQESISTT